MLSSSVDIEFPFSRQKMYHYHPHLTGRQTSNNQTSPPSGYRHNTTASPGDVAHFFQTAPSHLPPFPLNTMENSVSRQSGTNPVISPNPSTAHWSSQTNQKSPEMFHHTKNDTTPLENNSNLPDENDPAVIISKSIPTCFELMPTNPKFWILPARLQGFPQDQLAFPYHHLAQGITPEIKDAPPIESFKYYSVNVDKHFNTIVENLSDLNNVLINLPLTTTWFPANNYSDANWYSLEGYKFVDGFVLEDLHWYYQNVLYTKENAPNTPAKSPSNIPPKPDFNDSQQVPQAAP